MTDIVRLKVSYQLNVRSVDFFLLFSTQKRLRQLFEHLFRALIQQKNMGKKRIFFLEKTIFLPRRTEYFY